MLDKYGHDYHKDDNVECDHCKHWSQQSTSKYFKFANETAEKDMSINSYVILFIDYSTYYCNWRSSVELTADKFISWGSNVTRNSGSIASGIITRIIGDTAYE